MILEIAHKNRSGQGEIARSLALCDLCKGEMIAVTSQRITAADFRRIVANGFNPFTENILVSPGMTLADLGAAFGWSPAQQYQMWKTNALANTTDWHVCAHCYQIIRRFCATTPNG